MRILYSLLLGTGLLLGGTCRATAQVLDAGFVPSLLTKQGDGIFASLKQPDGKVLVAGSFQLLNGQSSPRVARLNADGRPDLTFRAQAGSGPNSSITALALQPDGKILLGAESNVTSYNGQPVQNLIRLNADGSLDGSFSAGGAGWQGGIFSIAVQPDGKILVGGTLSAIFNGQPTNGLIRLLPGGVRDVSFVTGSGFTSSVGTGEVRKLLVQSDGTIVAAGQFNTFDGQPGNAILRLTATGARDASFASPLGNYAYVYDMIRQPDGKLVVAGNALTGINNTATIVVRVLPNGTLDPAFTSVQANGYAFGLVLRADGSLVVAGYYNALGGSNHFGLARLNSAGAIDATFATAGANNLLNVVELTNGQYLVGGYFSNIGSFNTVGLARFQANGAIDTSYTVLLENLVYTPLTPQNNGQLVLNGNGLTTFNGQPITAGYPVFHRVNADGTYNGLITLPPGNPRTNGGNYLYNAFPQADGTFYATYQNTDSTALVRCVLANGTFDPAFTVAELKWTGAFGPLGASDISVPPGGGLLVRGSFTKVSGQPRRYLVRLLANGTLNTQFAPPTNAVWQVSSVGVGNTAGLRGAYGLANGQTLVLWNDATRSYLARLNLNGNLDNSFSIGSGGGPGTVFSVLPLAGDNLLVNGGFTTFNGQAAPYGLLRLLPSGASDPTFAAASAGYAFVEQTDGKLLVVAPGTNSQNERLVRLSSTGSFDAGFQPVAILNETYQLAAAAVYLQPGTNAILLSGYFTSVAGQPRFGLARLVNTPLATRAGAAALLAEVFPNPAHEQMSVRLPAAPTGPATVADVQGRTVRRWTMARATDNLPLHGLAPGLYLLSVPTGAGIVRQRFAVE